MPQANVRAFIISLMGGRMVAAGGSAPIGGRSTDACPYESEKQAEVSLRSKAPKAMTGRIGIGAHRHRRETEPRPTMLGLGRM